VDIVALLIVVLNVGKRMDTTNVPKEMMLIAWKSMMTQCNLNVARATAICAGMKTVVTEKILTVVILTPYVSPVMMNMVGFVPSVV